ncbi:hypothetical protein Sango_1565800 [Sesamum angolense]|uniref:Uncharacterized protein n=1 Tax=Sesamum angolense TaxID=2727404 RepID=A0AAE2BTM1_9LAMI|nr:hypothetical protein Sango_1565800 [Sesamum angolense]
MIMKKSIPEAFRGTMSEILTEAKDFPEHIEKREYIMKMSHLASKLKALKLDLSEDLLVHFILISLPTQFNQFKVSYDSQKETWSLNEVISYCVQEEERLKQDKTEYAHLASTLKGKDKGKKMKKDNGAVDTAPQKKQQKNQIIQRLCVTFVKLKGILRRTAPTFTHGVLRKVCLSCQKPNDVERYIYVGDGKAVLVEAIGKFRLLFKNRMLFGT